MKKLKEAMDGFTGFTAKTLDDPTSIDKLEVLIKQLSDYKYKLTGLSEKIKAPYNKNYISYDDGSNKREPEKKYTYECS